MLSSNYAVSDEINCNGALDEELIRRLHKIVSDILVESRLRLDSGNCVQAAATAAASLKMLGFVPEKDFKFISTHLHVHIYIPSTGQIMDPTIGQFFHHDTETALKIAENNGFLGTREELLDFFERHFESDSNRIARAGWRIERGNNSYIQFDPPQDEAKISAEEMMRDILDDFPTSSQSAKIKNALVGSLGVCDLNELDDTRSVTCPIHTSSYQVLNSSEEGWIRNILFL